MRFLGHTAKKPCSVSRSLGKLLFFGTCLLFSVALVWFARAGGYDSDDVHLPPTLLYWIGAVVGFLALLGYFYFRASLKPSNWLVRASIDRLVIKFRSHLNDHFPDDDAVIVVVPFTEIGWIRRARETLSNPSSSGDGDRVESWTYLDVKLSGGDLDALGDSLRTERGREAPKVGFSRTKHHHYPVRLVDDNILRIQWAGVSPRIKKALKILGKKLPVEPDWKIRNAAWEELGRQGVGRSNPGPAGTWRQNRRHGSREDEIRLQHYGSKEFHRRDSEPVGRSRRSDSAGRSRRSDSAGRSRRTTPQCR